MNRKKVIEYFGGVTKAAEGLGLSRAGFWLYQDPLTDYQLFRIERWMKKEEARRASMTKKQMELETKKSRRRKS